MFKCDFILDGDCQLYSEPCRSVETKKCKLYLECHSCRYKMTPSDSEHCIDCFARHKKKASQ